MAFMYLGEREPKQDWASMLAQAGATGLGVYNQLQYQRDQPEYKIAQERLKNMQLSQQAIAGLPPELQQEVYSGINAARMSPGRAATEGDLAYSARVGSPGSPLWTEDQNKLKLQSQGITVGQQAIDSGAIKGRIEASTEADKILQGGPLLTQQMQDESGYRRAATGLTTAQTGDVAANAKDRAFNTQSARISANASASQAASDAQKVGMMGQQFANEATRLRLQESKDLNIEQKNFIKEMDTGSKDLLTLTMKRSAVKKETTGEEQKRQLADLDSASTGILLAKVATLKLEKGISPESRKDFAKSIANGFLSIAGSQAGGALTSLENGDMAGYYADIASYKSTLSNLKGLATEIPSVTTAMAILDKSLQKARTKFAVRTTMEDRAAGTLPSMFPERAAAARLKAIENETYTQQR